MVTWIAFVVGVAVNVGLLATGHYDAAATEAAVLAALCFWLPRRSHSVKSRGSLVLTVRSSGCVVTAVTDSQGNAWTKL